MTVLSLGVSLYMMSSAGKISPAIAFVSIGSSALIYGVMYQFRKK
ncbi:MAG: hypothetical protein ACPG4S_03290 [Schleiferiaceae bacterium]